MAHPMTDARTLTLAAPAKINLFLHVTGRRDDGYHALESVFAPISLADTVVLTLRCDGEVRLVNPPSGLSTASDLACRAARALQSITSIDLGVDIELKKRIPQGAGLGGGSSDAAATLLGLNRLWRLGFSREKLQEIAATLGADVPFFVFGRPALAQGIGERLRAVSVPMLHLVVASPGVPVATALVFSHPNLTRNTAPLTTAIFDLNFGRNDLQAVAEGLAVEISELIQDFVDIGGSGLSPRMTGSGSCVFALATSAMAATQLCGELRGRGRQAWAVHTLPQHPLYRLANDATISGFL
jgi:4-diphosphocytidyl-2-C-methyl-D-erythritol kinase